MPDDADDFAAALPPEVLEAATAALADEGAARDDAFAAVCAAFPDHTAALQGLRADLSAVERLLDGSDEHAAAMPREIGPYRVVRRLGGGAFGEVFLCEQQEPVRRQVAVKVLRAGAGDRTTTLRFAAERQLIASLQHPAIAQVFDAGTLADGRPFFVMDAIDGTPLDRYCDEQALTVEARIELFCDLCRGVQHAHERGIVHRDLKPANVLIVEIDGRPRPKVIDFGIAKVLQQSRVPRAFDTEAGRVVGTPGYMSPEQQKGSSDDVDARADVFGLGVMLYELLCGQLPWSARAAATDTDPQRPSTRVSSSAASSMAIARQRATEPRRLANRLRGELDWIVLKCLQRERAHRYATAQELVDDLERHRRAEPVRARPPSTAYRLRKFVRRHRTGAVALVSTAAVAVLGLVLAQHYRRSVDGRLDAATAMADASFADAAAAVALLVERANDPAVREAPQGDTAREAMLRDALSFHDRLLKSRPTDPTVRANRCRALLGLTHVYWLFGDAQRATEFAQLAVEEGDELYAADASNPEFRGLLGEARCRHAVARSLAGDTAGALASFRAAREHLEAAASAMPTRFARPYISALRGSATMLAPHLIEDRLNGLRETLRALESMRSAPPFAEFAYELVFTSCELANELRIATRLADAEDVLRQADTELPLVTTERLHLAYRVNSQRAMVAFQATDVQNAIVHHEAALAAATAWEREQPNRLLPRLLRGRAWRSLGWAQNYAGDFDASVRSFREAIAIGEALLEQFPADAARVDELVAVLDGFALTLFDRFRQHVLGEAAASIARAVTLDAKRAAATPGTPTNWGLLCRQAAIADANTADGGDRYWPRVEAALPDEPKAVGRAQDDVLAAYAGLCRWHLDHGRIAAATAALAKADAWIAADPKFHAKRTVDVGWLAARLAAAADDHAACATAADRVLAARSTWYGRRRAADCLHLGWRCAAADPQAAAQAVAYRDRALALYRQVLDALDGDVDNDPSDPWYVLPWGIAGIRAAELTAAAGNAASASALLAEALPRLEAVRADAHADQWDEQAYRDGRALRDKLAAAGR